MRGRDAATRRGRCYWRTRLLAYFRRHVVLAAEGGSDRCAWQPGQGLQTPLMTHCGDRVRAWYVCLGSARRMGYARLPRAAPRVWPGLWLVRASARTGAISTLLFFFCCLRAALVLACTRRPGLCYRAAAPASASRVRDMRISAVRCLLHSTARLRGLAWMARPVQRSERVSMPSICDEQCVLASPSFWIHNARPWRVWSFSGPTIVQARRHPEDRVDTTCRNLCSTRHTLRRIQSPADTDSPSHLHRQQTP